MKILETTASDIAALQNVLNETALFPSDMLPDMVAPFLSGNPSDGLWLTCIHKEVAIGFCYAKPEALTEGTWNMLAIAVLPALQGQGVGATLTQAMEKALRAQGVRILIVDTSGSKDFALTRAFYAKNGYAEEARIRGFWADGDDKVIFRKAL